MHDESGVEELQNNLYHQAMSSDYYSARRFSGSLAAISNTVCAIRGDERRFYLSSFDIDLAY